jgi:integrase
VLVEDFQSPRTEIIDGETVTVAGRLLIRQLGTNLRRSKSGKTRDVFLTAEGSEFFAGLVKNREPHEPMFLRADGHPWKKSQQGHPMASVCDKAGIRSICFHTLRHTWASLAIMAGMPLDVVARNLGHADISMVQRHYGHLARNYLEAQVLRAAPRFV